MVLPAPPLTDSSKSSLYQCDCCGELLPRQSQCSRLLELCLVKDQTDKEQILFIPVEGFEVQVLREECWDNYGEQLMKLMDQDTAPHSLPPHWPRCAICTAPLRNDTPCVVVWEVLVTDQAKDDQLGFDGLRPINARPMYLGGCCLETLLTEVYEAWAPKDLRRKLKQLGEDEAYMPF